MVQKEIQKAIAEVVESVEKEEGVKLDIDIASLIDKSNEVKDVLADFIMAKAFVSAEKANKIANRINAVLKEYNVLTPQQRKEIYTKITKDEFLQRLNDEETFNLAVNVIKDAMMADKPVVVDKQIEYEPDYHVRLKAFDRWAELNDLKVKEEEEKVNKTLNIITINPTDSQPDWDKLASGFNDE